MFKYNFKHNFKYEATTSHTRLQHQKLKKPRLQIRNNNYTIAIATNE